MSVVPSGATPPTPTYGARPPQSITSDQLRNFFAVKPTVQFPMWTIAFFVLALCPLCGLIGTLSSSGSSSAGGAAFGLFVVTLVLAGVGALGIYLAYGPLRKFNSRDTITSAEYKGWLDYQAEVARNKAYKRLNIDPDPESLAKHVQVVAEPVVLLGSVSAPVILPTSDRPWSIASVCQVYDGDTPKERWYRKPRFLLMFPRQDILQIYEYTIDAAYTATTDDSQNDVFYNQIVGIGSSQEQVNFPIGNTSISVSSVKITLSMTGGQQVSISQPVALHITEEESENELQVKKLRELVRNMQSRAQGGFPGGGYGPQTYGTPGGYGAPGYGAPGYGAPSYGPQTYGTPAGPSVPFSGGPFPPQYPPTQPGQNYPTVPGAYPPQGYPQQPEYPSQGPQPGYPQAPSQPSQPLNPAEANQGYPAQVPGYAPPPAPGAGAPVQEPAAPPPPAPPTTEPGA